MKEAGILNFGLSRFLREVKRSKNPKRVIFLQFKFLQHFIQSRIRTQLFYIFNWNSKILNFGQLKAKNAIIYSNFDINSKTFQFYNSSAICNNDITTKMSKYWYRILKLQDDMNVDSESTSVTRGPYKLVPHL